MGPVPPCGRTCVGLRLGRKGQNLVRVLLRASLVLAGAVGACIAFAATASADVVDPASAYQPASTRLVSEKPSREEQKPLLQAEPLEQAFYRGGEQRDEVVATPAPEQLVTQAPARIAPREHASEQAGSVLDRAVQRAQEGFRDISAFLGRVTSASQGGAASGAGGPVVVLAVLSVVAALDQRRVLRTRWATDEDMPELLYAREVICPG